MIMIMIKIKKRDASQSAAMSGYDGPAGSSRSAWPRKSNEKADNRWEKQQTALTRFFRSGSFTGKTNFYW
jgi:hypothetical protein